MQNLLKSVFGSAFFLIAAILFLYSIMQMVVNGTALGFNWFGAFISTAAIISFLIGLFTKNKARTPKVLWSLLIGVFMGLAVVLYAGLRDVNVGYDGSQAMTTVGMQWQPLIITLYCCLGSIVYIFWYSQLNRPATPRLMEGKELPEFLVQNLAGQQVSSRSLRGTPALIMFHRGNWCPLCTAQIKELLQYYQRLNELGVNVWVVSTQSEAETQKLADRHHVDFKFMQDADGSAANALNIHHANGLPLGLQCLGYPSDTTYPTVIAVNQQHLITFVDKTDNYRVRPEPSEFMRVFEA